MTVARGSWRSSANAPLFVCNLPEQVVHHLQLRSSEYEEEASKSAETTQGPQSNAKSYKDPNSFEQNGVPACTVCPGCEPFKTLAEQRTHFRSVWHRYNLVLKQREGASSAVTQSELDQLCAEIEEEEELVDTDTLTALFDRLDLHSAPPRPDDVVNTNQTQIVQEALRSPLIWFESRSDAPDNAKLEQTQLGIYRDVLAATSSAPAIDAPSAIAALKALQVPVLSIRPQKNGWTGKRLQGTKKVGRAIQMDVLDGTSLLPRLIGHSNLYDDDLTDETMSESDTSSSDEETPQESGALATSDPEAPLSLPQMRYWTFLMMGGGHFAAAVVALNMYEPPLSERAKNRGTKQERGIVVVAHKTFHRYTTRRKQGGAQSAHDTSGRHAKSAGANLRRYGEAQLKNDIYTLLSRPGWRALIEKSEHVWVRAGMRAASGVLWHWPSGTSPLDAPYHDGTLSHIPIATQRPTLSEIMRCFFELTRVKLAHLTTEQLAEQDDAHREAIAAALRADAAANVPPPPPRLSKKKPAIKPDVAEKKLRERWERLLNMIRKGKLGVLEHFLERFEDELLRSEPSLDQTQDDREKIDTPLPSWWRKEEAKSSRLVPETLLQLAAAADQPELVQYFLERRANPTLPVSPVDTTSTVATQHPFRTAYDLCSSKTTRAVFRRMMAEHPDWYAWDTMGPGGARVPSALTSDMLEAQASKARTRRNAMRDKMREREKAEADNQNAALTTVADDPQETRNVSMTTASPQKPATGNTQRLGGAGAAPDVTLSDEMRARIERERRARAAEARMQALKKS
ncbi:hypothetical protein MYAM1_001384 [Malassezia yamatoensis]|uniref:VLRF1 domain-containing protein n=1 Tax=Malassezia yamatoensis TaxID=253288 RepID=A0AAJ6CHD9_9BASI|nr:hypothetical protein MYAM1_001384 [Malassezia yamatoensis]